MKRITKYFVPVMLLFISLLSGLFLSGCADSLNAPDKIPPLVELYKPAKGDTVIWGKKSLIYNASDDQKISYFELWVNGKFIKHYDANDDGTNPDIAWEIDSSLVDSKASVYIVAFDMAGNSSRSNENTDIIISENTLPPAAPKNLVVKKLSETAVNLSWEDSASNESEYQVWRKDGDGPYKQIQTLPKNSVSTNDYELLASTVYSYKVIAKNKYGQAASNEASTSEAKSLPVYNLNAVAKGTADVMLTWVDNTPNELGFVIQRKVSSAYNFSEIARTLPNTTYFEDNKSLSAGATYTYRVAAIYSTGFSEWSEEKTVTTLSQNSLPPSNLSASLISGTKKIVLSWTNNTSHNGTRIERKTGQGGAYSEIGKVDYNNTAYVDSNISESNTFYYRVRGYLYSGDYTSYSNEAMVSVPVLPPAAPSSLTLTRINNTIFNLKWSDNSDDEDGFEIWRKDGDGSSADYNLVATVAKNSTSTNDLVYQDNITYYYKVRAFRGQAKSVFSNVINSTGGTGNLPRPTNVSAYPTKTSVTIDWTYPTSPSNILGFEIEKKVSWGNFSLIKMVLPTDRQYIDNSNLTASLIYVYRVRAITSNEQSDWSDEITVTIPSYSQRK